MLDNISFGLHHIDLTYESLVPVILEETLKTHDGVPVKYRP